MASANNISAALLKPDRMSNHNNEDSFKYKVDCQSRIDPENPETKEWLEIQNKFMHYGDVKVFSGILEKKKSIIVKIGTDILKKEYEIGKLIDNIKIPTFISFICIFSCNDDYKSLDSKSLHNNTASRKYLCRKEGEKLTILVMPNIKLGLLYKYTWVQHNFHILKNILKHIVMSLCYARIKIGFVHNDLHYGNVLLQKSTRKNIDYEDFGQLETFGFIPVIIDYDKSIIKKNDEMIEPDIYNDFHRIINGICQDVNTVFDVINFTNLNNKYISKKTKISNEVCNNICKEIDKFEIRYIKTERLAMFKQ